MARIRSVHAALFVAMTAASLALASAGTTPATTGERADRAEILPMRDRAALENAWLTERLDALVPDLMRELGIDMWIIVGREYDEDPVLETMLPATWLSARRRTVLVFSDTGGSVGRLAVSRYPVGTDFEAAWDPETQPDQWARLADIVADHDPARIAINTSSLFAHADGLGHLQHEEMTAALAPKYRRRIESGEELAMRWLETREPSEMEAYPGIVRIAHDIIDEAFSRSVITPGKTTTKDVEWWMRDKLIALGLGTWFHPSVSIQREQKQEDPEWAAALRAEQTIRPGDLLHVDFGVTYLGLNTDTQQHAYVLTSGETEAPEGLSAGIAAVNRAADHLTGCYTVGETSNAILACARKAATAEGLRPSYYSHGIGYHGHGASSPIGWWDDQGRDHPMGNRAMRADTAWSIELNTTEAVPEWGGQDVVFKAEEDAFFDGETVQYLDGRQTRLHLIPSD